MFSLFIHLAIYFQGTAIRISAELFDRIFLPLLDALLIFAGYLFITPYWEQIRFHDPGYYPPQFIRYVVPVYILFWLLGILFSGGYKKPINLVKVARGILWGTISILLIYSLVVEEFRFSRALILIGSFWAAFILILYRIIFHWLENKSIRA